MKQYRLRRGEPLLPFTEASPHPPPPSPLEAEKGRPEPPAGDRSPALRAVERGTGGEAPHIDFKTALNEQQYAACVHGDEPLLILAGAGSGKTRTIIHRIAWLVLERGVKPWQILAMTFTNKAAGEMRERVHALLGGDERLTCGLSVGTFHSTAARLLRRFAERLGYPADYAIYDAADQEKLAKEVLRELGIGERLMTPAAALHRLEQEKNAGRSPDEFKQSEFDFVGKHFQRFYEAYQAKLKKLGAMDFGDLIVNFYRLLKYDAAVAELLRARFQWMLVDEFQDTNRAQYLLLRELTRGTGRLCVVGDDDQSIYRWRGAVVGNILAFPRDYPGTRVVKLERNYRSTQHILSAAGGVIARNRARHEKNLWTDRGDGERVRVVAHDSEHAEARFVAGEIAAAQQRGGAWSAFAIFYRTNALSRVFEEIFTQAAIPYRLVGAIKFYERKEIKDTLAYLRLLVNTRNDIDFSRVVNVPARGIGDKTVERLTAAATARGLSLYDTAALAREKGALDLGPGAADKVARFHALLESLREAASRLPLTELIKEILDRSGYWEALSSDNSDEARARLENIEELISAARDYCDAHGATALPAVGEQGVARPGEGNADDFLTGGERVTSPLSGFLELAALAGAEHGAAGGAAVTLMTVHSAKGLEFDRVYVAGMEEGLFPHSRSLNDNDELEEERRLCYVAMTRARCGLTLSHAATRTVFGNVSPQRVSRFIAETPADHVERDDRTTARSPYADDLDGDSGWRGYEYRSPRGTPPAVQRPRPVRSAASTSPFPDYEGVVVRDVDADPEDPFGKGKRVRHAKFGVGEVRGRDGTGANAKVRVYFPGAGLKTIIQRFLETAGE